MNFVKPKKKLGQHFLTETAIAAKIANSLTLHENYNFVLEIGPGKGILTKFLLLNNDFSTYVVEIDQESINYLISEFIIDENQIINKDFLKLDLNSIFSEQFAVIGNFPYNISSQILFKILENRNQIPEVVGMFQKEVARRIVSAPSSKEYGILSVLTQAWYKTEYLFTVNEGVFFPPPKVKSGVIRLQRNDKTSLNCDEGKFIQIVKAGFNQRRKTLRNALSSFDLQSYNNFDSIQHLMSMRAEQLSVEDFVMIAKVLC